MKADYFRENTIAAIITGQNVQAAIGVVRVSGPQALEKVLQISTKVNGEPFVPSKIKSHYFYRAKYVVGNGVLIDDGMLVYMKAPNSFTGEHCLELHLHGNPLVLKKIMQALMAVGVDSALPGEFSFRAFKNAKITLDQAESISTLIAANTDIAAGRAVEQLGKNSASEVSRLKSELVNRLAQIEVDIDFSDQGLSILDYSAWANELRKWADEINFVRNEFVRSAPLREGVKIAFFGVPNSGKSSLFNLMLEEERSIVSDEAGTTRDIVRESIYLDGLLLRISDTAGVRETENAIEAKGIHKAIGEVSSADIVLWVIDGATVTNEEFTAGLQSLVQVGGGLGKVIALWNKADLNSSVSPQISQLLQQHGLDLIKVSALSGAGFSDLKTAIVSRFANLTEKPSFLISRTRHFEVLGRAVEAVNGAIEKVECGERMPDVLAADLRSALDAFGELTGEFSSEDLLRHIFAEFCIGK